MVFISYASEDFAIAENIKNKLDDRKIPVWTYESSMRYGSEWRKAIDEGIQRSDLMICVMTEHSVRSPYVTYEWAFALGRNVKVIPLFFNSIDEKLIHPRLAVLQGISFSANNTPWDRLLNQIIAELNSFPSEALRALIDNMLKVVCGGISSPYTPESAKLRAFVFIKRGNSLVCVHFWAPYKVREVRGLTFEINEQTKEKVVVVKAAEEKRAVALEVKPLPPELSGVSGDVEKDLTYVLAAPINDADGNVIGIVDLDASSLNGKEILSRETSMSVIYELGQHFSLLLNSNRN